MKMANIYKICKISTEIHIYIYYIFSITLYCNSSNFHRYFMATTRIFDKTDNNYSVHLSRSTQLCQYMLITIIVACHLFCYTKTHESNRRQKLFSIITQVIKNSIEFDETFLVPFQFWRKK